MDSHNYQVARSGYVVKIGESVDPLLVGGKGASLSRMRALGLRVPDGLTITTEAWSEWSAGRLTIEDLYHQHVLPLIEELFPRLGTGKQMVSVRSGAAQSMPGMMETVLSVGAKYNKDKTLYLLSLIRAMGMDLSPVDELIDKQLVSNNTFFVERAYDSDLVEALAEYAGVSMGKGVNYHLINAIYLVFNSWNSDKAKTYRRAKGISDNLGTACTIQLMVDGTNGYTGVMLTRGEIDWLPETQGSSIVDGSHRVRNRADFYSSHSLASQNQLLGAGKKLEREYGDAVDIEFTHDGEYLYFLQCRVAKRTPVDAMRIAVELYNDGIYSPDQVMAVPVVDDSVSEYKATRGGLYGSGLPINGKLIKGRASIDPGGEVLPGDIVFREITTTSDIDMMLHSAAVVTLVGGPSCHAALVARELNTTVVVGVGGIISKRNIETKHTQTSTFAWNNGEKTIRDGDIITITPDGAIYTADAEFSHETRPGEWSVKLAQLQQGIMNGVKKPRAKKPRAKKPRKTATKYETTPTLEPIPF